MWYIELATTCYCRLWASWLLPSVGEGSFCCNTKVVHSSWDQWGFGLGRLTYPSRALLHPVMRRLWTRSGNSNVCPPLQASIYNSPFFLLANSLKSSVAIDYDYFCSTNLSLYVWATASWSTPIWLPAQTVEGATFTQIRSRNLFQTRRR